MIDDTARYFDDDGTQVPPSHKATEDKQARNDIFLDSRSPLPRGQVYTCESRCGNDPGAPGLYQTQQGGAII